MKANELRIGNWVKWPGEKEPNEVQWQHGHWLGVFKGNYSFPEPIPLTEEWLLKFGFKKIGNQFIIENGRITLTDDIKYGNQFIYEFTSLVYVHQLQNLYFALTGNELEIKL